MAKRARDVTRHWNRQDLDQHYTDHHHHHTSAPLAQTDTWQARVFARLSVSAYLCDLMIAPKRDYRKGLQIPEDSSPLERKQEQCFGGGGRTGGECQASSNVYPTQGKIQCPRWYSLQRHTYISSSTTDSWSRTHTHTSSLMLHCRTASKWNVGARLMNSYIYMCVCYWI